ncbi:MAG TPA: DNA-processing protein DprA [Candidatus Paceibacterota bacterium]|jgi:DNA processing protein|nr:DNA-processing protein DprA [Candidatus Paceibacterota bacterium]
MEEFPIQTISIDEYFPQLKEIPQPPKKLYMRGSLESSEGRTFVTVVGSRSYTPYGKFVCEKLISGLRGYPVTIVSGLAIGIDSIAHQAALDVGLPTVAFPGSGLDWNVLYPANNKKLAKRILQNGGALLSEFEHRVIGAPWTFPQRNRLEAGIASITIIIEAREKSGTLITARLATEYNKIVGAVPGPINAESSVGANWLLKLGAIPITESADILKELGFALPGELPFYANKGPTIILNETEELIMSALNAPLSRDTIIEKLRLDPVTAAIAFSTLEIKGIIKEEYGLIAKK